MIVVGAKTMKPPLASLSADFAEAMLFSESLLIFRFGYSHAAQSAQPTQVCIDVLVIATGRVVFLFVFGKIVCLPAFCLVRVGLEIFPSLANALLPVSGILCTKMRFPAELAMWQMVDATSPLLRWELPERFRSPACHAGFHL